MATESQPVEYVQKFRFDVQVPGIDDGVKFAEASGFAMELSQVEQPEGGRLTNHKRPGKLSADDLTLKRGASTSLQLFQWFKSLGDAASSTGLVPTDVRTLTVRVKGADGRTLKRFVFYEAWVKRYVPGDLDASDDGENQIEEVVVAYDHFDILPGD
jgi:phage tail-like protein